MAALKQNLANNVNFQRHKDRISFFQGAVQELPDSGKFDLIVCAIPFLNLDVEIVRDIFKKFRALSTDQLVAIEEEDVASLKRAQLEAFTNSQLQALTNAQIDGLRKAQLSGLATETVAHIANPFSRREIGEPSLLHEIDFRPDVALIGPYEKVNFDGRRIKSVSAVLRDRDARAIGVLCINLDVTQLLAAVDLLAALTRVPSGAGQPAVLFQEDWHERINQYVHAWTARKNVSITGLSRAQKRQLFGELASDRKSGV